MKPISPQILRIANGLFIFTLLFLSGCANRQAPVATPSPIPSGLDWREIPLKDVRSGESFRVADFSGKWVLIDLMAVWCINCLLQQQQIQLASADWTDDQVVVISLDMEPKETEFILNRHAEKNNISWRSAVVPEEMIKRMIAEFGDIVLFVSATPLILISPDGSTQLIGRGLKPRKVLQQLIKVKPE